MAAAHGQFSRIHQSPGGAKWRLIQPIVGIRIALSYSKKFTRVFLRITVVQYWLREKNSDCNVMAAQ